MSTVFSLKSDDAFITAIGEEFIKVVRYNPSGHLADVAYVGPAAQQYDALEVFGTTIEGDQLKQLVKELKAVEEDYGIYIFVNHLGRCIVTGFSLPTIKAMRINVYFGWSKYGVKFPQDVSKFTVWNRADMQDGQGTSRAMEEANKALQRSLEEKNVELAACKLELEWSKKMESLSGKLVEEKEKELETVKNQLLAFKATLRSLADH